MWNKRLALWAVCLKLETYVVSAVRKVLKLMPGGRTSLFSTKTKISDLID